jgi:hypothetical protein
LPQPRPSVASTTARQALIERVDHPRQSPPHTYQTARLQIRPHRRIRCRPPLVISDDSIGCLLPDIRTGIQRRPCSGLILSGRAEQARTSLLHNNLWYQLNVRTHRSIPDRGPGITPNTGSSYHPLGAHGRKAQLARMERLNLSKGFRDLHSSRYSIVLASHLDDRTRAP